MNWLQNGSWKTTSAGLLTIFGGLTKFAFAVKNSVVTEDLVMSCLVVIVAGLGLMLARDNDRSTEQVRAAKTGNTEFLVKTPEEKTETKQP